MTRIAEFCAHIADEEIKVVADAVKKADSERDRADIEVFAAYHIEGADDFSVREHMNPNFLLFL